MTAPRVLVAIGPRMYAEGLASSLATHRPRAEVTILAPPEGVEHGALRVRPHLIVAHRVPPEARVGGCFWLEVAQLVGGEGAKPLGAQISADGYSRSVAEVRTEHVLAALDRAEEQLLLGSGHAQEGGGGP
ncbi:MAG: hypothetical protein AVDCRST_MAG25-1732 [uncultured Rubrobacteraceae bacterium]|uniref:Uncharacterized protein n=1 Tax=uncultured Rubrobacteraceae bacterium TaxID=349277 RepID=A0A6J4RB00_9ACTN|nr:MAG: hypothetical protein AVDCRST_MAG25-1732 [uncultured Rubrobacteraceae bacterium]